MAKDTEKLIRQLSLISFLMAERRPVSALEIKRDVEGYSDMNDDAFARRFYADRSELESLGIRLKVEKPADGHLEAEVYTLPPENFYLPPIEFTDGELAALQTALSLLDGSFAYAEPLRLALQQLTWGRPSPLDSPKQRSVAVAVTASAGGRDLSHRLSKIETAIERRKTIEFTYYTMERDTIEKRRVDPYHLIFQGGQFYLVGYSHERDALRVFRLSRMRGKVSYATKAEHDFQPRKDFDPRSFANRVFWQFGDTIGTASIWISDRVSWLVEREFAAYGSVRGVEPRDGAPRSGAVFETDYATPRQLLSWVFGLLDNARVLHPAELVEDAEQRLELLETRHTGEFKVAEALPEVHADLEEPAADGSAEAKIRPERFARLVTLAGILIDAARRGEQPPVADVCGRLQLAEPELRDDISLLNVVNFGAGSYVIYAEIVDDRIEVDPEPYGDNFAQPARLLPLEAKALVAAIDLLGDHLPEGSLKSVRQKVVAALGEDPAADGLQIAQGGGDDSKLAKLINRAITDHRLLEIDYYKVNEDEFTSRCVEPYGLINGREGWYVFAFDPERDATRHFRLDRVREARVSRRKFKPREGIDPLGESEGWPRTGQVPASQTARVWISPERARWAREERFVSQELADGSVIVDLPFAGTDWLVREVVKEAGDAVVLEPQGARSAVVAAVRRCRRGAGGKAPKRAKVRA